MAEKKTSVLALATKNLKKSDDQKALDLLKENIEENENSFQNALFAAKKDVKSAQKTVDALEANPNASAQQIIDAARALKLAVANVEDITEIMDRRF